MSFFGRLKNIIKSNLFYNSEEVDLSDVINDIESKETFCENDTDSVNTNSAEPDAEYYAILEVPYGAAFEEIKKSYKRLLKKYHPDHYHKDAEKYKTAEKLVGKINEAYGYFEQKFK
ncbi:MAG: DnaJ domain-containing protein [Candidatus Gastranaerophilales bacterium]|nr:DnaJ domain-containing protein [Candidatus Gastranaerophilales bacterium]